MEEIQCIFCNAASDRIAIEENGFLGRLCESCELIYVSPRPSPNEIVDLYAHGEAHLSPHHHLRTLHLKGLYARHHLRLIAPHAAGGSVLEVGAGGGAFLDAARNNGYAPYGIELSEQQAAHIRDVVGIPCESTPMSRASFGGRTFDIIYHSDVIGHFSDPIGELHASHALLNDGGLFVVETGNLPDVSEEFHRFFTNYQLPDHLFSFGRKSLETLLSRTGFELIDIHGYSITPQLRVMKAVVAIRGLLRGSSKTAPPNGSTTQPGARATAPGLSYALLRWPFDWFMYFLRYGVGALAPKAGRPQTLIVIARKSAKPNAERSTAGARTV